MSHQSMESLPTVPVGAAALPANAEGASRSTQGRTLSPEYVDLSPRGLPLKVYFDSEKGFTTESI